MSPTTAVTNKSHLDRFMDREDKNGTRNTGPRGFIFPPLSLARLSIWSDVGTEPVRLLHLYSLRIPTGSFFVFYHPNPSWVSSGFLFNDPLDAHSAGLRLQQVAMRTFCQPIRLAILITGTELVFDLILHFS